MKPSELQQWEASFEAELRLRGAGGREVGEALATVRSHCHDTLTHPDEAFGDPVTYADTLRPTGLGVTTVLRRMLPSLVTVGAFLVSLYLPHGGPTDAVMIRLGAVAATLGYLAMLCLMAWLEHRRARRPVWLVTLVAAFGGWFWLVSLRRPLFPAPMWSLWLLDACLIALACWLTRREQRDRPRDPITGADLEWQKRSPILIWWFPGLAAFMLALRVAPSLL